MKAQEQSFIFLAQTICLKIPFFQRQYVWKEENWLELFDDLLAAGDKFFGSIIWKFESANTNDVKTATVIDGQQRLTTLSIFFKALTDSLPEEHQEQAQKQANALLFYYPNALSKEQLIKIEHSALDRQHYENVIRNSLTINQTEKNGILGCYNYFKNKLNSLQIEDKTRIFNWLTNDKNKILVVIELSENEDEQKIFDTINTAGVHLSVFDIVKNALFAHILHNTQDPQDVIKLHNKTFQSTFYENDEDRKYWDEEIKVGRLKFDTTEILLHAIAVIKGFYDPEQNRLEQLSSLYKTYIKKLEIKQCTGFIEEICQYAKLYREQFVPIGDNNQLEYNDTFTRLRHILEKADISVFNPYLLKKFKDLSDVKKSSALTNIEKDNAEKIFENKCKELEVYIMRHFISGNETKNYNKICKDLLSEKTLPNFPNNDDISVNLRKISNKKATLILFWIELYNRRDKSRFDITSLNYGYTLEHIMPQTWEQYWGLSKLPTENEDDFNKRKVKRSNTIYAIGNMTLLKGGLNTSVRNYEFPRKIDAGKQVRNDIRRCGDLLMTKEIISEYDDSKRQGNDFVWDEEKIEQRTKKIEQSFFILWPSN